MGRGLKISDALSPHELRIEARRAETPRAAARMYAIASALEGKSRDEAARCAGMDRQALRDAVARYNAEGLDGLYDRDRPGRPRHLSRKQEARLTKLILKGPNPEKDGISAYTLDDLVHISEEKFGVSYHPSSMSRVVRRLGFSRQKARPSHPMKDPASQEAFKKSPKTLQKIADTHKGKRTRLFFQDEARVGQKGRVCHVWFTEGKRPPGLADKRFTFAYVLRCRRARHR